MKILKICSIAMLSFLLAFSLSACNFFNKMECDTKEKVELASAVFSEVDFENSEGVILSQECKEVEISGQIEAMTDAQKSAFADNNVSHVVVLKITFDNERTLDEVEIKGEKTKVYSTNVEAENYVGSLTDLLDNEAGEDAYCYLILSAHTKDYLITARYSDEKEVEISLKISATLAESNVEE